ncbi:RNA 2'-phosphotransferase [Morganella psychrotolerans]|uniref:RNA 2'-phosphotransferase n=1 Tax=Morganella psychrotolerans TaxID=368603 RepID=UPI00228749CB|nr:RNA 2'-phosphotransferase [Morganella psychrotolerans]
MNEYERVSKLLSHVLRHEPEFIDIHPDNDGWTDITLLLRQLQIHGTPLSREMLEKIVQDNHTDLSQFHLTGCLSARHRDIAPHRQPLTTRRRPRRIFFFTVRR